jgi:diguanylate cyclase (GGDEF)-like protein/PAS domain S-box-containing protein
MKGSGAAGPPRDARELSARDRTAQVLDTAHEAFVSIDSDGRVTVWNTEAERLFGYSRQYAAGRTLEELIIPPAYREAHRYGLERFLATGEGPVINQRLELSAVRSDGMELPIEITISAIQVRGEWVFNAFLHDITDRKRAEQYRDAQLALSSVLANTSSLEEAAPQLLETLATAMDWRIGALWQREQSGERLEATHIWQLGGVDADPFLAATRELRFECGVGLPGRVWKDAKPHSLDDVQADRNFPRIAAAARAGLHGAIGLPVSSAGQVCGVLEFFGPTIRPPDTQLLGVLDGFSTQIGQFLDRTRAEAQLAHHTVHDPLTGLPNRTLLLDRLRQGLGRLSRSTSSLAMLFCDIDDFKTINDGLGHATGDELLVAAADRLRAVLRPADTAARFGADHFAIVCEELISAEQALEIGRRLLEEFAVPFDLDGRQVHGTISIGIAVTTEPHMSPDVLMREADAAMHRAKAHGGARFELSDNTMGRYAVDRLQAKDALRQAIAGDELTLVYQPEVSLETGEMLGVEALVRWDHPHRGRLSPDEFIPLAEASGLIVPLGEWVLREACTQASRWHAAHPERRPLAVAINLSARQFRQPELASMIEQALRDTGVDPGRIWFELTETTFMDDLDGGMHGLEALRALGTHVAIDDFGVGFSSLDYLKRLTAIEMLKIDRSFTNSMLVDRRDHAIIQALLSLASSLELRAVVEGVETAEQARELRALGCDYGQGYFFARPEPAEAIERLLQTGRVVFDAGHEREGAA